jgi:hypothetical protein
MHYVDFGADSRRIDNGNEFVQTLTGTTDRQDTVELVPQVIAHSFAS